MDYPFGVFHRGFLGYPGCDHDGLLSSSEENGVLESVKRKTSARLQTVRDTPYLSRGQNRTGDLQVGIYQVYRCRTFDHWSFTFLFFYFSFSFLSLSERPGVRSRTDMAICHHFPSSLPCHPNPSLADPCLSLQTPNIGELSSPSFAL